jgi:hypothetical protein
LKVGKTYNCFIFFTNWGNISCVNCFLKGKTSFRYKCKHKCFKLYGQVIFNNQQAHILKKQFLLHMIFLERFGSKKLTITLLDGFNIFLASCLSISSFNGLCISSSNILQ